MNNNTELFSRVLSSYKLVKLVDIQIQNYIIINRKKNIKRILISLNRNKRLYYFSFLFYVTIRKFGFKLSMLSCKVVVIGSITAILALSTSTTYYAGKYIYNKLFYNRTKNIKTVDELIINKKQKAINNVDADIEQKKVTSINKPKTNQKIENIKDYKLYTIAFSPFKTTENINNSQLNSDLLLSLKKIGKDQKMEFVVDSVNNEYVVNGSIQKIGTLYSLKVEMIGVKKSDLYLVIRENIPNKNKIKSVCNKIAAKIIKRLASLHK